MLDPGDPLLRRVRTAAAGSGHPRRAFLLSGCSRGAWLVLGMSVAGIAGGCIRHGRRAWRGVRDPVPPASGTGGSLTLRHLSRSRSCELSETVVIRPVLLALCALVVAAWVFGALSWLAIVSVAVVVFGYLTTRRRGRLIRAAGGRRQDGRTTPAGLALKPL